MGQRLTFSSKLKRVAKAQGNRVRTGRNVGNHELLGVDPKADDLLMARLKVG
jgi:hypothetical protein